MEGGKVRGRGREVRVYLRMGILGSGAYFPN